MTVREALRAAALPPSPTGRPGRVRFVASDALLPVGLVLWGIGVGQIDATRLPGLGLVDVLPITFYLGLAVVLVSASLLLRSARPPRVRVALHLGGLALMLYGTPALVYSEPRYAWLYKHVGVVQYIAANGHLAKHVDIYQNWPGFFAVADLFDRVAGISSPLAVAAWAQLFFNVCTIIVLAFAFRALPLTWRERCLALFLFTAANWVAQDYFSPQAAGFVLSIGVYAIALHWCMDQRAPAWLRRLSSKLPGRPPSPATRAGPPVAPTSDVPRRRRRPPPVRVLAALLFIYAALVVTHELSPYMIVIQLGLLTGCGLLRPRWLAPAMLGIALLYLAPRFGYVNQTYGILASVGNFFSNVRPPSVLAVRLSSDQALIARAAELLSVIVWGLAALGAWRRRRAGRPILTLVILAVSPVVLLGLQHYGGEALLRVFLFSLPWSACLAASAINPAGRRREPNRWLVPAAALLLSAGLFLIAYFGSDGVDAMTPGAVAASKYLDQHGQPGAVLYVDENFPASVGARYPQFLSRTFLLEDIRRADTALTARDVPSITSIAAHDASISSTAYLVVDDSMLSYAHAYGLTRSKSFASFREGLDHSPEWELFYRSGSTSIYQLRPTPQS